MTQSKQNCYKTILNQDDAENETSKRSHREDCVKLEKDLRVKTRDDEEKEVDIGAVNTRTDQLLPGIELSLSVFPLPQLQKRGTQEGIAEQTVYDTN